MFKMICKDKMFNANKSVTALKSNKTYNYREDKSNLDWAMIQ
jgi:hypothetical protein